jgi:hypothetical protein
VSEWLSTKFHRLDVISKGIGPPDKEEEPFGSKSVPIAKDAYRKFKRTEPSSKLNTFMRTRQDSDSRLKRPL